jgi:competence protein ComEC
VPNQGFWTVDDITSVPTISEHLRDQMLLRMVHASDHGPGGVRYLLAHRDCVEIREASSDAQYPKFSYGLAYNLVQRRLSSLVQEINYGSVTARTPVLTVEHLHDCVQRLHNAETRMREELNGILAGLETGPLSDHSELPGDTEYREKPPWAFRVHVINVGQGDTIVLEFPQRRLWIIDAYFWCKSRYDAFRRWLDANVRGYVIEKAVISHCHYDHIRSMNEVINDLSPLEVLVADVPTPPPNQTTNHVLGVARQRRTLRMIRQVEDVNIGPTTVRLYPTTALPGNPALGPDPNEHGIIVAVKTDKSISLLPGDVPGRLLGCLIQDPFFGGNIMKRFYKVTHHCSATGDDSAFLAGFVANEAVTSCSRANRYRHPHDPPERRIAANTRAARPQGYHRKTFETNKLVLPPYALP